MQDAYQENLRLKALIFCLKLFTSEVHVLMVKPSPAGVDYIN